MIKRLSLLTAIALAGAAVSAQAQWVSGALSPNNGGTPFWDNPSWDASTNDATHGCNIGFVLTGVAGNHDNPCSNQHPNSPNWLPYMGFSNANGDFTGANAAPTGYDASPDFQFSAGTYDFTSLGVIAGNNPETWGISSNGTTCSTSAVTLGTPYIATSGFDLCILTNDGLAFSNTGSQFALFGLSGATLGTGGGQFIVGFEDLYTGNGLKNVQTDNYSDGDYQDLVLGIYANIGGGPTGGLTPEPMTMSLMAMGLVGLGGAQLRRRRNRK
jgi:hypothetical protein